MKQEREETKVDKFADDYESGGSDYDIDAEDLEGQREIL